MAREWTIEDPTPEDMEALDCSSVEPLDVEGYDPNTDEDNEANVDEVAEND